MSSFIPRKCLYINRLAKHTNELLCSSIASSFPCKEPENFRSECSSYNCYLFPAYSYLTCLFLAITLTITRKHTTQLKKQALRMVCNSTDLPGQRRIGHERPRRAWVALQCSYSRMTWKQVWKQEIRWRHFHWRLKLEKAEFCCFRSLI